MNKATTSLLCAILLFISILTPSAIADDYKGIPFITTYLPKEYNAGMQNNDLLQDQRGVIYIANNYGLLEYDGSRWRVYSVSNGTKVRSVSLHANGRIYVGAQNQFGYFFPSPTGLMTYHSLSDLLPDNKQQIGEVWKCYVIEKNIYFCTDTHIYKYDGQSVTIVAHDIEIGSSFVIGNQLYIYQEHKGLSLIEKDHQIMVYGSEAFANKRIAGLLPLANERLLVCTEEDGLYFYNGSKFEKWKVSANQTLSSVFIQTVLPLSTHVIAIGTRNNGLFLISNEGQILSKLDKERGFNNKAIFGLMEDEFGNLWVGQNNGLARIEISSPFTYITDQFDLEGAGYCSYSNKDGLYLGTNNGLYLIKNNKETHDDLNDYSTSKPINGQIYSIREFENKILLGHEDGATFLDRGTVNRFSNTEGAWKFIVPQNNSSLLLEGNYLGMKLYRKENKQWISSGLLDGLRESSRVFLENVDGTIWMTHGYKGVFKIYPAQDYSKIDSVRFYDEKDGFATNRLINVFNINNENVFCSGAGIYRYDKESDRFVLHEKFTEIFGSAIHIREMQEDGNGNIYFMASDYSGVLIKDKFNNYSIDTKIFNKIHSKLNDDLEDISVLDFGNVLFGAHEGFIHYDPQKQSVLLNPIKVLIRRMISTNNDQIIFEGSFQKNGEVVANQPDNSTPEFSYGSNSILFQFSSTFVDEDLKTEYSYYLKGYESDWSIWTTNTEKEYTNLREGNYEFIVKAKNIYDIESEVTSYQFSINPPWYRTKLAYFLYFVLFAGTISTIVISQNVVHKKEKKVMKLTQKRELIRKDNEIVELSEKSKAEIMKLQNENLELEINTKNKELASSTMNLIDKNQLLTGLKNDIKHILDQDKKNSNTRALKEMIKKIDRSITHDDEWEHFQQYFDQVHGDFTTRLRQQFSNLSPQEVKLSNYLRMSLSTKEIAQLMNITTRGVEIARYRLRKKLNLDREVNLSEFIGRF
ncbi:two component regulator three y domain-containing protein [Reichenbachiella agarivorans]|uniref:Two component regulator three y domain-containing protein n=1 Tax=Reichenbachiella agarivorans TaxID=2979464 RepID=A0ABY6CQD5_9BACT|nr:triple tyrosine motif-containing protein [Reichenbachiella agarivorans]UXP32731.1 two component regulator three y domain-containing protein [Reichenbachiella agarivorans]